MRAVEEIDRMEAPKPSNEEMISRGLPSVSLLAAGPKLLANAAGSANTYALSTYVDKKRALDEFLSHTWRSNRWLKYIALLFHFNGQFALKAAHTVALVAFLVQLGMRFGLGQHLPVLYEHVVPGGSYTIRQTGLSLCFGGLTGVLAIFFGHRLRLSSCSQRPYYTFLDKCCIHQTDVKLKKEGILSIGDVLIRSRGMLVLWDDDYFERLWCTYELAGFIRCKGSDAGHKIRILPLFQAAAIVGLFLVTLCALSVFIPYLTLNAKYQVIDLRVWWQFFLFYHVPATCVCWVPKLILCQWSAGARRRMHEQLADFEVKKAKVSCEEDRVVVERSIIEWFGSLEKFNDLLRRFNVPYHGAYGVKSWINSELLESSEGTAPPMTSVFSLNPWMARTLSIKSWSTSSSSSSEVSRTPSPSNATLQGIRGPYCMQMFHNLPCWCLFGYDSVVLAEDTQAAMAIFLIGVQRYFIVCPLITICAMKTAVFCEYIKNWRLRFALQALAVNAFGIWLPLVLMAAVNFPLWISGVATIVGASAVFAVYGSK
jgi:hypothetical protein